MAPPPIELFLTTIASAPALRQRQEYILRTLQVKKIPFTSYDLASDEDAKRLWKRKAPPDKQQLPGILVGGKFPGTFAEFEEAVEFAELEIFLRRNEDYKPPELDGPALVARPIGVPGAYEPLQMFPKHAPSRSPSPSPRKLREKEKGEIDASDQLGEFGLEGVSVSADDLRALVEELGLGGDEASDLIKGLGGGDAPAPKPEKSKEAKKETIAVKPKEPKDAPEIKVQSGATELGGDGVSDPIKALAAVLAKKPETSKKEEETTTVKPETSKAEEKTTTVEPNKSEDTRETVVVKADDGPEGTPEIRVQSEQAADTKTPDEADPVTSEPTMTKSD